MNAALDALATVLPNDIPVRIVLRVMLVTIVTGWTDERDPERSDLDRLTAALDQAVTLG